MKSLIFSYLLIILAVIQQNDGLPTKEMKKLTSRGLLEDITAAKTDLNLVIQSTADQLVEELEFVTYLNYNESQRLGYLYQDLLDFKVDGMEVSSLRSDIDMEIVNKTHASAIQLQNARGVRAAASDAYYYLNNKFPDHAILTQLLSNLETADNVAWESLIQFEQDLLDLQQSIKIKVDEITINLSAAEKLQIDNALTSIKSDMDANIRNMMFALIMMNDSTSDAMLAIQIVIDDLPNEPPPSKKPMV